MGVDLDIKIDPMQLAVLGAVGFVALFAYANRDNFANWFKGLFDLGGILEGNGGSGGNGSKGYIPSGGPDPGTEYRLYEDETERRLSSWYVDSIKWSALFSKYEPPSVPSGATASEVSEWAGVEVGTPYVEGGYWYAEVL